MPRQATSPGQPQNRTLDNEKKNPRFLRKQEYHNVTMQPELRQNQDRRNKIDKWLNRRKKRNVDECNFSKIEQILRAGNVPVHN